MIFYGPDPIERPLPPVAKQGPHGINYRPDELCELLAARPELAGICDRVDVVAGMGGAA